MGIFCVVSFWLVFGPMMLGEAQSAQDLTILYSSEHHGAALPLKSQEQGAVGGFARRATIVRTVEREGNPVLLVDTGDLLIGTVMSSWFRGEPDILAMNMLRYDAMVAGNHDFDYGLSHLQALRDLADFPILCTNLRSQAGHLPCQASFVTRLGSISVGILGVVGESNFPETFNPKVVKHLRLLDSVQAVEAEVVHLRRQYHVELIVLLTHQNTEEDRGLLETLHDVDVIIGGHTEGFEGMYVPEGSHPIFEQDSPRAVYVKTHRQGRTIGRLDITMEHGEIVHAKVMNIPVLASHPEEPDISGLVKQYQQRFSKEARNVLGRTTVRLQGERPVVRTQESNFGNLLTDLMRKRFQGDVALINGGHIRGSLQQGDITYGDILSVLPFNSSLVTLELPGQVLWEALEHSVSRWPNHDGRFLQVSGLRATFHMNVATGFRLQEVLVGGRPLKSDKLYAVVTDSFVADGGDGYRMFSRATKRVEHQLLLRDLFHQALLERPVHATLEGRLVLRSPSHVP